MEDKTVLLLDVHGTPHQWRTSEKGFPDLPDNIMIHSCKYMVG